MAAVLEWTGKKFLAVTAFVVAFPPVFSGFGKTEGLKLSLAILLLYLVRGIIQLLVEVGVACSDGGAAIRNGKKNGHHSQISSLITRAVQLLPPVGLTI